MCDVRKSVLRLAGFGLAVVLMAGAFSTAEAQRTQIRRPRRETNASRQARIARTIADTYSHRYEVFGGGGFERFRAGEYLKKNDEISWAASTSYYFNPKWAVVGSAQGSFGSAKTYTNTQYTTLVPKAQINEYYFMAGPSYRFYMKEKVALSAQAQVGVGWGIFGGGSKSIPPDGYYSGGVFYPTLGIWPDSTRVAFSLGLSGDYNLYPNIALRLTPLYMGTTFGGNVQNNLGFNAGVIYRFGRQK